MFNDISQKEIDAIQKRLQNGMHERDIAEDMAMDFGGSCCSWLSEIEKQKMETKEAFN